jgi:uncharacterized membrane protein YedE/YeeE
MAIAMLVVIERPIDRRLFVGTTLVGIGWGLVGLCPCPALVALSAGGTGRAFVAAMAAGILVAGRIDTR